jgi:hypothetical protein
METTDYNNNQALYSQANWGRLDNNQALYSQANWGRLEMKPHEPKKKQEQNKGEKGGGKQRVIKTKSKKMRKDNKMLSQKKRKGVGKT